MKQEIKVSEIMRVERLLQEVESRVAIDGRKETIFRITSQMQIYQFSDEKKYKDLKTQLNWVRSNEG